jgi:cell division protein FtsL
MKIVAVLSEIIEKLVMLIFVLTGVSVAFAMNYLMWQALFTSDFAKMKELQTQVQEQSRRLEKLEQWDQP